MTLAGQPRDAAGEVHVHGYEIEKPIEAGGTVQVDFTADIDGKFEIEQHFETGERTTSRSPSSRCSPASGSD